MRNLILSTVVACAPFAVSAATLTGDTVDITIHGIGTQSVVVGSGNDFQLLGVTLDFDAGSGNMQLGWASNKLGTFGSFNSWTFSDLDFDDGSDLIGFVVSDTAFSGLTVSVTSDSVNFMFDDTSSFSRGVVLNGSFVTDSMAQQVSPPAAIPLPATAPLLLLGAAGLMAMRRRKART